ncbi:MAG: hypothetical protein M3069_04145 [Chloroflexota bacterium]|nr:hypothetical protein [Chloroflexota bacterium]
MPADTPPDNPQPKPKDESDTDSRRTPPPERKAGWDAAQAPLPKDATTDQAEVTSGWDETSAPGRATETETTQERIGATIERSPYQTEDAEGLIYKVFPANPEAESQYAGLSPIQQDQVFARGWDQVAAKYNDTPYLGSSNVIVSEVNTDQVTTRYAYVTTNVPPSLITDLQANGIRVIEGAPGEHTEKMALRTRSSENITEVHNTLSMQRVCSQACADALTKYVNQEGVTITPKDYGMLSRVSSDGREPPRVVQSSDLKQIQMQDNLKNELDDLREFIRTQIGDLVPPSGW